MRISDWSSDVCSSDLHATPPPAATAPTTMTPAPAATAGMGTPAAMVAFTSVELGSTVDARNTIVASGTSFAPKDTIYAPVEIVSASCRERVGSYVYISVVAGSLKKNHAHKQTN